MIEKSEAKIFVHGSAPFTGQEGTTIELDRDDVIDLVFDLTKTIAMTSYKTAYLTIVTPDKVEVTSVPSDGWYNVYYRTPGARWWNCNLLLTHNGTYSEALDSVDDIGGAVQFITGPFSSLEVAGKMAVEAGGGWAG